MKTQHENTSKLINYWLRHKPQDAELEVDEFGWAKIDKVLSALHDKNIFFSVDNLVELNNNFDKVRWEIDIEKNRIRATHGHSFPVLLDEKLKIPPDILYHGTAIISVPKIMADGLLPMSRHLVHLSETIEAAAIVAKRHGKPFIIEIDTLELVKDGWTFYHVWLTTKIPTKYLSFEPWFKVEPSDDKEQYALKELKREIGNRRSHFLYQHLENLELVWNTGVCDDTLFADKKTGKHYMVHLTYTRKEQEIEGYPNIDVYNTFEEWVEKGLWTDQQYFYELDESTE